MIVSHKHKFIFLKTTKTAGTSIEIALSRYCGKDDIITPITPEDEKIRSDLGYPGPQNYLAPIRDYRSKDWAKLIFLLRRKRRFFNHIGAKEVTALVGNRVWNSYYTFCFERNPWDRVISLYYHSHKSDRRPSIADYIESGAPLYLKRRGYDLYTENGEVVVDRVCRFENLVEELNAIRKQLGFSEESVLPRAKSKTRKDKRSYRDILGEAERDAISEIFCDEIELFGYEF